jgi:putative ABC transport system permease protein
MWLNYLKVALRNARRHRGYAALNVAGLALGLACCLLIALHVQDELRYDRHHAHADRIYRVLNERASEEGVAGDGAARIAVTPPGLAPTLEREVPEVEHAVRLFDFGRTLVARGERGAYEDHVLGADPAFFDVFTVPLVAGDARTALAEPNTLVLSASAARRHFGDADPVGQTLRLSDDTDARVTGVMADGPAQSHLRADLLLSFASVEAMADDPERMRNWVWQQFYTYVLLRTGADPAALQDKLRALIPRHADAQTQPQGFRYADFPLQPLRDVYLRSAGVTFDLAPRGDATYVYAFGAVALFILLLACVNFTNLATARAAERAREVGLRKAIGARRGQLARQFLVESALTALVATALAVGLVALALPGFNAFAGKALGLPASPAFWLGVGALGLGVGLLAGAYPALFLAGFQPAAVLRGAFGGIRGRPALRRGLVGFQFAVTTLLLIGTAVVYRQLDFLQHTDPGFDREQVVVLPLRGGMDPETVKAELLRHPGVVAAAASWGVPGGIVAGDGVRLPGSEAEFSTNMFTVDLDYVRTFGMRVVAGRAFSPAFPTDAEEAFMLNETAARELGWTPETAVGQPLEWNRWDDAGVKRGRVVGVVEDFHFRSMHQAVEPLVLHVFAPAFGNVSVRVRPENLPATLAHLEATWGRHAPAWPFEYTFLDADFAALYRAEARLGQLLALFAGLAVLVACLGLLGQSAYAVRQRAKEVGVRKVLGASAASIVALLSRDTLGLVLGAFAVAAPAAYLLTSRWLEGFAYRVDLGPGVFLAAGALALAVALLTVSTQALRAAAADPVKALRSE